MNNSSISTKRRIDTLPLKLEQSVESLSLICICGHWINCHSDGIGGGLSICEEDEGFCGCMYPEIDYDQTIMNHYFITNDSRWLITKLTTDVKKQWTASLHGLPLRKEINPMVLFNV